MTDTETLPDSTYFPMLASELETLANPNCTACSLHEWTDEVCVPTKVARKGLKVQGERRRLILLGEYPGWDEGDSGVFLYKALEEVGLKPEWFFSASVAKCQWSDKLGVKQIRTCVGKYLVPEISLIEADMGITFGNPGLQATWGKTGITKMNGQQFEAFGVQWVPAFSPSAVLRYPKYRTPFMQALLVFSRMLRNEDGQPVTESYTVNDREMLKELIDQLKSAQVASIDVETWSKHPGHGRFKGGGLAWWDPTFVLATINFTFTEGKSYVLPLWHEEARWKNPQKVMDILKPYVEGVDMWIMQNGQYDSKCVGVFGWDIIHSEDTMGLAYALDENNLKGLGFLSQVYLGAPEYKDDVDKSKMTTEPLEAVVEYGGRDTDYTFRLAPILRRRLQGELSSLRLYDKLLLPASQTLVALERRGIPLDRRKFDERRIEAQENADQCLEQMFDTVGYEFNPRSNPQLGEVLFGDLGFPVIERTKAGKASANEATLIRLRDLDTSGFVDSLLEYRKWQGYISRYFNSWAALVDEDWRLHTHFKPFHTVTGRLSSENPNMQQVPRDFFIRGIIGGRPGWKMVEVDYSQAELRIVAHVTQDPVMLRAYHTDRDLHMETAVAVTGLDESQVDSETRKKAKAVNFGFVYGMGYRKFADYAKTNYNVEVSLDEAKETRRLYFDLYRKLLPWHERQRRAAERRGWVISPIGRKRRLHDIRSTNRAIQQEAARQAINSPVQSLASDMMLYAMTILEDLLPENEARLISTVHDSLIFEIREECVDKWLPIIMETMNNLPLKEEFDCELTVPIKTDAKVGDYWSEGAVEL